MIALEISSLKQFMGQLFSGDIFDHFLLSEAVLSTGFTYTIDGRRNREFYTEEEWNNKELCPYENATWQDMKPLLFQLIKGNKTPLFFKLILQLSPENTSKILTSNNCSVSPDMVKALILTIKYDGNKAILTTGTSFHTFLMTKEPDEIWDKALLKFLSLKGIAYEQV